MHNEIHQAYIGTTGNGEINALADRLKLPPVESIQICSPPRVGCKAKKEPPWVAGRAIS